MDTEYPVVDDLRLLGRSGRYGRQTQIVEDVTAVPPDVDRAVFAQTLVVEAVDLGDLPGLVVAADERDAVGIPHLEGQKQQEGLDAVEAAVDEVPCSQCAME